MLEFEIPEIYDGTIEIMSIVREAGSRTKVAVKANDEQIDAVGSCVGFKGTRIQNILNEVGNERIDIIEYNENPEIYIANAISPAEAIEVKVDVDNRSAIVIIDDSQLSLAIGKDGQNARLAAKLTGWKVDIKSCEQYNKMIESANELAAQDELIVDDVIDIEKEEMSVDEEN